HLVVTRELTFHSKTPTRDPQERVEPEDGAECFGRQLYYPIASSDVRKLVGQHNPDSVPRPFPGGRRQHDLRVPPTPRDEDGRVVALKETYWRPDLKGTAKRIANLEPGTAIDFARLRRQPAKAPQSNQQDKTAREAAGEPECQGDGRSTRRLWAPSR